MGKYPCTIYGYEYIQGEFLRFHNEELHDKLILKIIKMANELGLKGIEIKEVEVINDNVHQDQCGVVFKG